MLTMMALQSALLGLLLLQAVPARSTSTLEFFKDKNCKQSVGKLNGTTDGVCKSAVSDNGSVRVVALDASCAATIYSDPYCSNDATIANIDTCMSGGLIVGSFSIDCETSDLTSSVYTEASKPTSSPSGFNVAASKSTPGSHSQSTATSGVGSEQTISNDPSVASQSSGERESSRGAIAPGAIAGIVVGCIVLVALLPIGYILRRSIKRESERAALSSAPREGANELYTNETAELPPRYPRPPPPPPPPIADVAPPVTYTDKSGYMRRAEADGTPLSPNGSAPPEYYTREKDLPPIPITVQKPGVFAELPDDSSSTTYTSSPSTSPVSAQSPQGPDMGRPF